MSVPIGSEIRSPGRLHDMPRPPGDVTSRRKLPELRGHERGLP